VQGPDGVIRPLKDRLRTLCKQRRIRLQEFFKPFDVHHIKKVSKGQFRRALDQAGLMAPARGAPASDRLTLKEVEVLSRRYEVEGSGKGDDAEVNYWKLCEQIEKVFTLRGLEKNPTLDVKLSLEDRPESGYGTNRPGLSAEEAGIVGGLLSRVRLFAATEGLIVKELFETFDKMNSGKVTATVYLRQLDSMFKGRLLLLRAYQTRDGDVSYRAMHVDCENTAASAVDQQRRRQQQQQQQQQQRRAQLATEHHHRPEEPMERQNRVPEEKGPGGDRVSSLPSNRAAGGGGGGEEEEEDCLDDSASVSSSVTGFAVPSTVGSSVGVGESRRSFSQPSGEGGAMEGICGGGGSGSGSGGGSSRGRRSGRGGGGRAGAGAAAVVGGLRDSLPIERQMACKV
ncbi:unnamed protein product, partial [Laminaria digitata]